MTKSITVRHYVDHSGAYMVSISDYFEGDAIVTPKPDEGLLEVPFPPDADGKIWNGSGWAAISASWESIRSTRDAKLASSDWTQLQDTALSEGARLAWATYRQALRDITDAFDSPSDVVWPASPNETE